MYARETKHTIKRDDLGWFIGRLGKSELLVVDNPVFIIALCWEVDIEAEG